MVEMTSESGDCTINRRRRRLMLRRARSAANNGNKAVTDENSMEVSLHSSGPSCASSSERSSDDDVSAVMLRKSSNQDVPPTPTKAAFVGSSYGCVSSIGRRREMEDAVCVELGFVSRDLFKDSYDFFGVYDGHGGAHVAVECKVLLHGIVKARLEGAEGRVVDWEDVMGRSFADMDAEVARKGEKAAGTVGSTAVVAVVGSELVVIANCGDSRAIISRGGAAIALSDDHKPNRPDELKRIEDAGGSVIERNGHRILGVLAISRSIGDHYLKPFVTPEPDVRVVERTHLDEFLILASDGLWDMLSNDHACQIVRRCLKGQNGRRPDQQVAKEHGTAAEAAALLARTAMAQGSSDNISVIVVELERPSRKLIA
ncbi:hypothetical protein SAY87_030799 [Trapa incisa]|uniref:protein-serine/threonine phosphatase n=1 Tax=Trapa incisa TaxID=236973 RepID=A0AAN7QK37_9MYRT|nr:hypothetical protein SAY87_030799 [Trapa incisa]